MKKNLLWSLFAATALLTACSNDNVIAPEGEITIPTGETVAMSFNVGVGNPIGTYATESDKGGWTNYKTNELMSKDYTPRAILRVYQMDAQGNVAANPMDVQTVYPDPVNDEFINFENLRLQANFTYVAVAWVDFVKKGDNPEDLFYDTQDLKSISMKDLTGDKDYETLDATGELRDAYTAKVTFTLASDGKYTSGGQTVGQENTTALAFTATRILAKLRIVMTDFDSKEEWTNFFDGNTNFRPLDYVSMEVDKMGSIYNAVSGSITPDGNGEFQYVHPYYSTVGGTDTTPYSVNNIKWVDKTGKSDENGVYPVVDFNYFIPTSVETTLNGSHTIKLKLYNMGEKDFADENLTNAQISSRTMSGIPLVKNCLTTIMGNFITYGYSFQLTVDDDFGNTADREVAFDTDSQTITQEIAGNGDAKAIVKITKNEDGEVTDIDVEGMDAVSQLDVIELLKKEGNHEELTDLTISASALTKGTFAINDISFKNVNITLTEDIPAEILLTANKIEVIAEKEMNNEVKVENRSGRVNINGLDFKGKVTVEAKVATIGGTSYENATITGNNVGVNATKFKVLNVEPIAFADSKLTIATTTEVTELSTGSETIELRGKIPTDGGKLALTAETEKAQTLKINSNANCRPSDENITVKKVQYYEIMKDTYNAWSTLPEDKLVTKTMPE